MDKALITVFEVMLGDLWNETMYGAMRSVGSLSSIYFVALIVSCHIIMLNLFLAILLGNFEKARNYGLKKKVFEAFKEIMFNGKTLNDSLDIILGDASPYVKKKILKWDNFQVTKVHT